MIALSSVTFDPDGHVLLRELPTSDLDAARRRVNRQATLDGGVAVNDYGFTHGDRTFTVRWVTGRNEYDSVQRLVRLYGRLRVSTRSGVYLVAPDRVIRRNKEGELTLLVLERLT